MLIDIEANRITKESNDEHFLGTHMICEFYGCDKLILDDIGIISIALEEAAIKSKATILEKVFHKFSPQGVSGVIVIAESHISIHTWPEHGYAAVDFFTCSKECDLNKAIDFLCDIFKSSKTHHLKILRGELKSNIAIV